MCHSLCATTGAATAGSPTAAVVAFPDVAVVAAACVTLHVLHVLLLLVHPLLLLLLLLLLPPLKSGADIAVSRTTAVAAFVDICFTRCRNKMPSYEGSPRMYDCGLT